MGLNQTKEARVMTKALTVDHAKQLILLKTEGMAGGRAWFSNIYDLQCRVTMLLKLVNC